MQDEKQLNITLLVYFSFLFMVVISNLIQEKGILDVIYLVVLLCCVFKSFIIVKAGK